MNYVSQNNYFLKKVFRGTMCVVIIMSFDGVMLHKIIETSKDNLIGGRISKVYQLEDFTFLFTVRKHKNLQLVISVSKQNTRMHISESSFDKPYNPPMFCMFLRKHLEGARIEAIDQVENDRIVQFKLIKKDELGDLKPMFLYFEAMGKDANLILTDNTNLIMDCLNHTHPFSEQRTMIPSATYVFPQDDRINPYNKKKTDEALKNNTFETTRDLLNTFQGISPVFAKECLHRSQTTNDNLVDGFENLLYANTYTILKGDRMVFASFEIHHKPGDLLPFDSPHKMLDHYFSMRENHQLHQQHFKTLSQLVKKNIAKQNRKIEKLTKQLHVSEDDETYRKKGELLMAYAHLITPGDNTVTLNDFETNAPLAIDLDREKTAIENAQWYFEKFKKAKKSLPYLKREIVRAKNERTYFQMIDDQLSYANLNDLLEIRNELKSHGYIKQGSSPKKQSKKAKHDTYIDADGVSIHVGKNNIQNAHITHSVAKHYHTWFHVKEAPGSHVVVEASLDALSETTIRTAAQLAAFHSKMRYSSSVAVDYTPVKNIKKIPGHKGYYVTYKNQTTIYIDPDESFIHSIKKS